METMTDSTVIIEERLWQQIQRALALVHAIAEEFAVCHSAGVVEGS